MLKPSNVLNILLTICLLCLSILCVAEENKEQTIDELQRLANSCDNDTGCVLLLTDLAMEYVIKPGSYDADMGTAIANTNKAMKLSIAAGYKRGIGRCCFVYSNICREQGKTEAGKRYIQQATGILSKHGTPADEANVYLEKANYIDIYSGGMSEKTKLHEAAVAKYRQTGLKKQLAEALKSTGDLFYLQERFAEGLTLTREALQLYKEIKYTKLQAVYDQLGMLTAETGQYKEALKYGLLALRTAEQEKDSSGMLCTIYNRLGTTYYYIEEADKAVQYYRVALALAIKNKDTMGAMEIANNMVNAHLKNRSPQKAIILLKSLESTYGHTRQYKDAALYKCHMMAYIRAKQYKLAEPYVAEAIERTRSYETDNPLRYWTEPYIIEYYIGVGKYHQAIILCGNMERLCKKYYKPNDMKGVYYSWYLLDSAIGKHKDALDHYKTYIVIKDSLNSERVKRETSQMLVQYETEKKEKDIQLLTQHNQLQQSQLQQATFSRNVTFAGIGLTLLILALLYNRYNLKQKSNRKLEQQQKEINEKNETLQHLLTEKEWLLKEIHHRIKNNLQTIMSLLNSQSAYLDNDAALAAIRDSRHRIHAMSLIHQKLYTTDNLSVIDMPTYIHELVGYMRDSFDTAQRILFKIEITPLKLDVAQAIPLALILNEAITNSLKYAFPNVRTGTIHILLKQQMNNHYLLVVADDGVGIPEGIKQRSGSLGMSLMKGLSEDLDGTFEIINNNGTTVTISFIHNVDIQQADAESLPTINPKK